MHDVHDQRLLTLVGCIRGIVLEFDGDARYLNAWADDPALLARPAREMIGCTIDDVLGAAIGAPFTAMVQRVYRTGDVEHLEYPLDLDTGRRWFFADIKRVEVHDGMTVVFFARDIYGLGRNQVARPQHQHVAGVGLRQAAQVGGGEQGPAVYGRRLPGPRRATLTRALIGLSPGIAAHRGD